MAFQNTNFITTLATAGTTLLSLSFVFAVSVQEFLGSCIFLFVKHPYDVGDRVDIAGPSGVELLVVEQISLLYTVFKRIDNMKIVQVPNIVLNTVWVENVTRSKAMKEQLEMFISFDTSLDDIELLRAEMETFVRHPDNSRDFQPDIFLEATGIGNMDKLQLRVEIRHKSNWHNETVRAVRRSKFMCALVLALRKVPIYAPGGGGEPLGGPTNPGYTVAISDEWATTARDKASQVKEGKRLVPTPNPNSEKSTEGTTEPGAESAASASLNARKPGFDTAHKDDYKRDGDDDDDDRDDDEDRRRSNDIDNLRQGLLKRESTRGRRRPGEHLPSIPSAEETPTLSITQASPRKRDRFSRGRSGTLVDEEREIGSSSSLGRLPSLAKTQSQPQQSQQQRMQGQRAMDAYSNFPTSQMAGGQGMGFQPQQQNAQAGVVAPSGYQTNDPMAQDERERALFSNVPLGGGAAGASGQAPARR